MQLLDREISSFEAENQMSWKQNRKVWKYIVKELLNF